MGGLTHHLEFPGIVALFPTVTTDYDAFKSAFLRKMSLL